MIIRIFSRPVFSFQLKLNNTDEETVIMRTPITIISIDKIINTFIIKLSYQLLFLFAHLWFRGALLMALGNRTPLLKFKGRCYCLLISTSVGFGHTVITPTKEIRPVPGKLFVDKTSLNLIRMRIA